MKTPPPPIWGETLEEDDYDGTEEFYNHEKAIKEMKDRKQKELAKLEANENKTKS